MRAVITACVLTLTWGTSACSKKLDCGPNAYVNADPAFCLALPDGYKAEKPSGTGPVSMSVHPTSSILGYTVYWNEGGDQSFDQRAQAVDRMGGGSLSSLKQEEKGDIPDGKWWKFRTGSGSIFSVTLVNSKKGVIRCELQNRPDADAQKELESCKSLRAN
jgi:hypothetical protein